MAIDIPGFALASLLVELTPGPNMAALAALAIARGRGPGLAAVAGVALGLAAVGALAALGLGLIVSNSPLAWEVLRWGGTAYLLWLAIETWRETPEDVTFDAGAPLARAFRDGLAINLMNPKAAVFYVTILPGFAHPGAGLGATLTLVAIYVGIATAVHAGIVLAAAWSRRFLDDARRTRIVRRVAALGLVGVALWMLVATAR